jgi:UDP-N-acetylglucosamine 2-epimerase (non-hydrolysing)
MRVTIIAGARPNFMKIAPIIHEIIKNKLLGKEIDFRLVHTGQHYDSKMSGDFFKQLEIPEPNINLESGGGTQSEQTANIMIRFEKELLLNPCDLLIVVGDVTSTMACSIVAQKQGIKVAHIEAGIRSNDWSMPEEINRLLTDSITNFFFTTTESASENLKKSGVNEKDIFFVGNTMIDTLLKHQSNFKKPSLWDEKNLQDQKYIMMTLHRPANVDDGEKLKNLIEEIIKHSQNLPIIFPVHPRTAKIISKLGINHSNLILIEPLGYLEFNYLIERSKLVVTDSGGITEETTVLKIPCITLRDNTERPETVDLGTNELIGTDPVNIGPNFKKLFDGNWKKGSIPPKWDGKTSERIIYHILNDCKL